MWCGASGFGILLPLLIRLTFFLRGEISPKMRSNRLVRAIDGQFSARCSSHIWLNDRAAGYNNPFSPEFVNVPHSDVEICLSCDDMACCWAIAINQVNLSGN
ncbi:hypothetical protein BDR03DRAFT_960616 [Suillus americanus]|nr:hypothetical protein BDR03DRAFT_960616 [Suillus americanus]